MADYRIFPSILPEEDSYGSIELTDEVDAWILQGIAAAHPTDEIDGQSAALEIASWLTGNHAADEIDGMVAIIEESEPPRSEIDLGEAIRDDGNLSYY
jgi:hypothetical protein